MYIPYVVILALLSVPPAVAETTAESETYLPHRLTGNDLLTACSSSTLTHRGRRKTSYCHGFVSGVEEGIRLWGSNYSTEFSQPFCVPPGTTSREMARAYVKYASGKNRNLGKPAVLVTIAALKNSYPC